MSLADLRAIRRAGKKPDSVIVLIGKADVDESEGIVQIEDEAQDLRPLVGLPVHVIDLTDNPDRTSRILDALHALKVKPLGICGPAGACGVSERHEYAMQLYRESLCQC